MLAGGTRITQVLAAEGISPENQLLLAVFEGILSKIEEIVV